MRPICRMQFIAKKHMSGIAEPAIVHQIAARGLRSHRRVELAGTLSSPVISWQGAQRPAAPQVEQGGGMLDVQRAPPWPTAWQGKLGTAQALVAAKEVCVPSCHLTRISQKPTSVSELHLQAGPPMY